MASVVHHHDVRIELTCNLAVVAPIPRPEQRVGPIACALVVHEGFTIGLTLAPADENGWVFLIPHSLTYLIEFQAYILLVLGAYLLGRSWLRPRIIGAWNRRQGYVRGLQQVGRLSLPALGLFVIGAIYEAFSLRYLVPLLVQGLI